MRKIPWYKYQLYIWFGVCQYFHALLKSLALPKSHQNFQGNSQGQLEAENKTAQCKRSQAIHMILNEKLDI